MTPDEAKQIIADAVIDSQTEPVDIADLWEDEYPEIGEGDWDDIVEIIANRSKVTTEAFTEAYRLLSARAES